MITHNTTLLVDCPHACVDKLRVLVVTDTTGTVLSVAFQGHEQDARRMDRPRTLERYSDRPLG